MLVQSTNTCDYFTESLAQTAQHDSERTKGTQQLPARVSKHMCLPWHASE